MTTQSVQRSLFAKIFLSPNERRLRAGWRIFFHLLLAAVLAVIFSGLLGVVFLFIPAPSDALVMLVSQFALMLAVFVSVWLARRFLDHRTFTSLGLVWNRQAFWDLFAGILIPGAMLGLIFLIEWVAGWLKIENFAWRADNPAQVFNAVCLDLALFIIVGWTEELITRGYWLQNLIDGLNLHWGVIISSSVFAILHLGNPNATLIILFGLTAAGLFFAYAFLRTRQLWLPIGLHIGWNFFEGTVFGFPVSGTTSYQLIRQSVSGPEMITGGAFGPEAGLILFPALLLGTAMIAVYTQSRRTPYRSQLPKAPNA